MEKSQGLFLPGFWLLAGSQITEKVIALIAKIKRTIQPHHITTPLFFDESPQRQWRNPDRING